MATTVKAHVDGLKDLDTKQRRYIMGNLAIAGIEADADAGPRTRSIVKRMLEKMRAREQVTRVVAEPNLGDFDSKLLHGIDPATGDKILAVTLPGNRRALYNPETRVTYPLPVEKQKKVLEGV